MNPIISITSDDTGMTTSVHDAIAFVGPAYAGRPYHNMDHVIQTCRAIDVLCNAEQPGSISDMDHQILQIAACFHDYVYAAGSPFNEEASAFVAGAWLETRGLESLGFIVTKLIMTTKTHAPSDIMCRVLSDADLWGLGYEEGFYMRNSDNIRIEFSHIDTRGFNAGRIGFLEKMLDRTYIYATKYARLTREYQARLNMTRELARLKGETYECN